jgi:uncharacterized RDD family membrane protein YckC
VRAQERLTIDTPEQVALELPVAGIGSRFLAATVDTVLQAVLYLAAIVALFFGLPSARPFGIARLIGPALAILFAFCVSWGYFAFFEIAWNGQTPGKRVAKIRVIKDSGRPINAFEAIGRNVLRAIDFLPALYALGVFVTLLNRYSRRIGDYVAGTVVVYDSWSDDLPLNWDLVSGSAPTTAPNIRLTAEELGLIETYLLRRFDLDPVVRDDMAGQIARRVTERTGVEPEADQSVDEFLEGVARQTRDSARFR